MTLGQFIAGLISAVAVSWFGVAIKYLYDKKVSNSQSVVNITDEVIRNLFAQVQWQSGEIHRLTDENNKCELRADRQEEEITSLKKEGEVRQQQLEHLTSQIENLQRSIPSAYGEK